MVRETPEGLNDNDPQHDRQWMRTLVQLQDLIHFSHEVLQKRSTPMRLAVASKVEEERERREQLLNNLVRTLTQADEAREATMTENPDQLNAKARVINLMTEITTILTHIGERYPELLP